MMMRKLSWMFACSVALIMLLGGCGQRDSVEADQVDEVDEAAEIDETDKGDAESELVTRARELAALAAAIEGAPERADEMLAEAGLDAEALDELLFEIASDPAASAAYTEAR
jgi:hypothetical protein